MKSAEGLRAELWKRPDDRSLLAVYADLLAAEGETTRAEYMQLALLAKRTPAQERRLTGLRTKHRGEWLGVARPFVWTWEEDEDSPGFVARAQCSVSKLAQGFEEVRALGPRLVVSIAQPKAKREVVALAKRPLGSLYGVALFENDAQWITDFVLATLAPTLHGLRVLELFPGEARATEVGWNALLPHLDALEELTLAMGWNPEGWLESLLGSSLVGTLRRLSVPGWIAPALKTRLKKELPRCEVTFRPERRSRFNRETRYYEP